MSSHDVRLVACGSPTHIADLTVLRERGLSIPHDYSSWPLHCTNGSWLWCRVIDLDGRLVSGFAVHLTGSRAIPGTRIGRIDRLGRNLHEELADEMGPILSQTASKIPRLLRLDVRIFDEELTRRRKLCHSLPGAGWAFDEQHRLYSHTLLLKLASSESEVLKTFSTRARSAIKKALGCPDLRFEPIVDCAYSERIRHLCRVAFRRTGAVPPHIDAEGILSDAVGGRSSLLIGAFARHAKPPEDLIALAWGRLHGDHASLEVNASDRSALFERLSPGFGLMLHLIEWAIEHNAAWIDLGGLGSTQPRPDDPMRGIAEFKMRFSSDFRDVAEEWHLDPRPWLTSAAAMARSMARALGSGPR